MRFGIKRVWIWATLALTVLAVPAVGQADSSRSLPVYDEGVRIDASELPASGAAGDMASGRARGSDVATVPVLPGRPPPFLETAPAAAPSAVNRDAVAVIIGNRGYRAGLPAVRFAHRDAEAMRRFVISVLGFRPGNIIDLRDAGQADLISVFGNRESHQGRLWQYVRPGRSDVFVFYSGHGVPGLKDHRGYLLPVDADPATAELNGYPLDRLLVNLERIEARSVTVLIDACFSGQSAGGWLIPSASPVYVATEPPARVEGIVLLTAAGPDQVASWDEHAGHGLFTHHVLQALRGAGDRPPHGDGDGAITLGEVQSYLDDEMSYAARRAFGRVQAASVTGDPRRVLVPKAPRSPSTSAAPISPVAATSVPAAAGGGPVIASLADAVDYLTRERPAVERAVRAFYRERGKIWDTVRVGISLQEPLALTRLYDIRVVRVGPDSFDIQASYRFRTDTRERSADGRFRIAVAAEGPVVTRMWR